MIGIRIGPQIGARLGPSIGSTAGGVIFIAATQAVATVPADILITAETPSGTAEGDTLLLLVAADREALDASLAVLPDGWSVASVLTTFGQILNVLRRTATDEEPEGHEITLPFVDDVQVGSVLVAYRGLDTGAPLVDSAIANVSSSTSFPCPSLTLTEASQLYLGVAFSTTPIGDVTPPAGATERIDASQDTLNAEESELEVFEFFHGAVGATGAKTATTAAAQSGFAASILLAAQ